MPQGCAAEENAVYLSEIYEADADLAHEAAITVLDIAEVNLADCESEHES